MIGATSGWRQGQVTRTCITVSFGNLYLMCQSFIGNMANTGGDSGAPIFSQISGDRVSLYGITWGNNGTEVGFSPMNGLHQDLGSFEVAEDPDPGYGGCPDPSQIICD